jgi:excisionase family DNA binding protein
MSANIAETLAQISPRYLRISQAAAYLGFATKTLYRLAAEKKILHIRKGRTLFFDRVALDKWMQAGTVSPLPVWNG